MIGNHHCRAIHVECGGLLPPSRGQLAASPRRIDTNHSNFRTALLGALLMLLPWFASAAIIPSGSITASASSVFFPSLTDASLTIDGSGLVGDLHGNDAQGNGMWLSASGGGGSAANNPAGLAGPAWLRYVFDTTYILDSVKVWNHNQLNLTDRGLRNVSIHVRVGSGAWQHVGNYELTRAPGTPNYPPGDEINLAGVHASQLLITALSPSANYGSAYYGLSELQLLGEPLPCWPDDHPLHLVSVEKDPVYTTMLAPRTSGWIGSDVAKSILLPNGKVVWLFGDTFIGSVMNGTRQPGAKFINNSIGLQDAIPGSAANMQFHWGAGDTSFFPHQPNTPGNLYWPTSGIYYRGELFIFCYSVASGFNLANTTLIRVTNPLATPAQWTWTAADFGIGRNNLNFHTAIFIDEPYIYFLGTENSGGSHAVLARMLGDDLAAGAHAEAMEFWVQGLGGPEWGQNPTSLVPLFPPGVTESDIQFIPAWGLYVTTTYNPFARTLYLVTAESLTGPWTDPVCLYDVPEWDMVSFDIISYAARPHPELSTQTGELFISYATNALGSIDPLFTQEGLAIYAPQMLRVVLERRGLSPVTSWEFH